MESALLFGSDERIHLLLGLLADFPRLLLFLLRRKRRVFAHARHLRVSVHFNRVVLFHH
jgi:hypothetical protein